MRDRIDRTDGWRRAEWALDDLQALCESRSLRCVVALIPRLETVVADPLRDVRTGFGDRARERGLEVVDLQPALATLPAAERLVMPADPHPSPAAHRLIAAEIAEVLETPQQLIKSRIFEGLKRLREMAPSDEGT